MMGTPLEPLALLTTPQAADECGICAETMAIWRRRGSGPPYVRLTSKSLRYRRADLADWVAACLITPNARGGA